MTSVASRITRALGVMTGRYQAVTSRDWEGWEINRLRSRGQARLVSQDKDLENGTREKLISEARRLCQTFPVAKAIASKFATYCVGKCKAKWNTGDKDIDALYEENWIQRMPMIDANGRHHFRKLARIAVVSMIRDGDVFAEKVSGAGHGQIKLIEADRVNNGNLFTPDTETMVGGVTLDSNGRAVSYRVTQRDGYGNFRNPQDISAQKILHVYDTMRAEAVRGVTSFDVALNSLRDLKEIIDAERSAVKLNSKIALLVKTVLGSARGRALFDSADSTQSTSGQAVQEEEINDAMTAYMFPSEDMKAHQSERPAGAWLQFSEFLVRQIAVGLNVPFGFVWSMLGTGPAVRFEISAGERVFMETHDTLCSRFLIPTAAFVTAMDIESGALPAHDRWDRFSFPKPTKLTIDFGRDTTAGIAAIKMGLSTATAWYEDEEEDFEDSTLTLAKEAAFRRQAAADAGVPVSDIREEQPQGGAQPGQQPAQPAVTPEDSDEVPEPDRDDAPAVVPDQLALDKMKIETDHKIAHAEARAIEMDSATRAASAKLVATAEERIHAKLKSKLAEVAEIAANAAADRAASDAALEACADAALKATLEHARAQELTARWASEPTMILRDDRNRAIAFRRGTMTLIPKRDADGRIVALEPEAVA